MRLKQYLVEDRKQEQAKKKIAKRLKVDTKFLEFVGKDGFGYYFNVTDRKHKDFQSTKFERI
jgi:hypothetical protein